MHMAYAHGGNDGEAAGEDTGAGAADETGAGAEPVPPMVKSTQDS